MGKDLHLLTKLNAQIAILQGNLSVFDEQPFFIPLRLPFEMNF